MGLFRKKPDPISERAKLLNEQIAALEVQIQHLSSQEQPPTAPSSPNPRAAATPSSGSAQQPRLRSTALPHGQSPAIPAPPAPPAATTPAAEPIFEEVDQERLQGHSKPDPGSPFNQLGVRKYDLNSSWDRLKNHFRGPVTSNPKLVHYLSAGSIQGLRPLRYEKRVARNRFIVLAAFLVLALWGIIAIFISRR